jgi:Tol biopolymer transport system component
MTVNVKPVGAVSNGKIVYNKAVHDGAGDIFVMNQDGSGKTQLTSDAAAIYSASFTPDGSTVAFTHVDQEAETYNISTINSDGTNLNYLSAQGLYVGWLPNSNRVSFFDSTDDANKLKTINTDQSDLQETGYSPTLEGLLNLGYHWSPDSTKVVYAFADGETYKIKVARVDGSGGDFVSTLPFSVAPNFSADGSKVYFAGSTDGNILSLYSVGASGGNQAFIAALPPGEPLNLIISPDGAKLLYLVNEGGGINSAYVLNIDGSNQAKVVNNIPDDDGIGVSGFGWSPDSSKLVYAQDIDGQHDIFTINSDGSNPTNLTNTPEENELIVYTRQAWGGVAEESDDSDNDGTPSSTEDAAPNNGDANNDGTKDSLQSNVTSLVDPVTGNYAVLAVSDDCTIESLSIAAESTNKTADAVYDYPNGMMDFNLDCGTPGFAADISQYYYKQDSKDLTLRKYNPATKAYATIDSASISTSLLQGKPLRRQHIK